MGAKYLEVEQIYSVKLVFDKNTGEPALIIHKVMEQLMRVDDHLFVFEGFFRMYCLESNLERCKVLIKLKAKNHLINKIEEIKNTVSLLEED